MPFLRFSLFLWLALVMGTVLTLVVHTLSASLRRFMEETGAGEVFIICSVVSFGLLILVAW